MSTTLEGPAGVGGAVSPGDRDRTGRRVAAAVARAAHALAIAALASLAWILALLPLAEALTSPVRLAIPEPTTLFFPLLRDGRQVTVKVTEAWRKVPLVVDAEEIVRDPILWNRMNFDDWDAVPERVRLAGLERMIARYRRAASGPLVWEAMTPDDWDHVPQPVRAMAFLGIANHWAARRGVGKAHRLPPREVADTLASLIMVESWFEHRAVAVDIAGNRDLGLAQASDFFRAHLEYLNREGRLDFGLTEGDYFNPWCSIRAGAVWLDFMIDEAGGDLDLAVRAYRKGIAAARRGEAEDYALNLKRKRERYVRNQGAPPTWDFLWRRLRPRLDPAPGANHSQEKRSGRSAGRRHQNHESRVLRAERSRASPAEERRPVPHREPPEVHHDPADQPVAGRPFPAGG